MTKQTQEHCLRPEAGRSLHATKRFQCCDTFRRQTGRALEDWETLNAAKNCFRTLPSSTFDKNGNWKQGGSVSSSLDQDWPVFVLFWFCLVFVF